MTVASYFLPRSLPEAVDLLGRHGPDLLVMAGGTVAMPLINEGISLPEVVMGLRRAGLDRLDRADGTLRIGATTTLTRLAEPGRRPDAPRCRTQHGQLVGPEHGHRRWQPLHAAARRRRRGRPAGPGCEPDARQRRGRAILPIADLYTGFMTNHWPPDELLVELRVPVRDAADRIRQVRAQAREHAGRRDRRRPDRVGRGPRRRRPHRPRRRGAAPHPGPQAEQLLVGTGLDAGRRRGGLICRGGEPSPFTDAIATDWYRRRMTRLFVGRGPRAAGARRRGGRSPA